jgi:general secretion pathway protein B
VSFILEALRKSESDRQRLGSVAIADLPIARRNRSQPWWVFGLSGLLLLNLVVLGVVLFRNATGTANSVTVPVKTTVAATTTAPTLAAEPQQVAVAPPPPSASNAGANNELQQAAARIDYETVPRSELELANAGASVPDGPTLVRPADALRGDATAGMSTADRDVANAKASQELRVDLHVYSNNPRERFVLINMRRYTEGQQLPNGATVEEITTDGVVIYQNGTRYRLDRR